MKNIVNNLCKKKLSENFILRFKNDLNWELLLEYQNFSTDFLDNISNILDKKWVYWYLVSKYQKLDTKFILKYDDCIFFEDLFSESSDTLYFSYDTLIRYLPYAHMIDQLYFKKKIDMIKKFQFIWIDKSYKYPTKNNLQGGCMYQLVKNRFLLQIK